MTLFRRPLPRFVLWALLLVAVAAGAGFAGLSSWIIAALVFGTWLVVALCERQLSGSWTATKAHTHAPAQRSGALAGPASASVEPPPDPDAFSAVRVIPAAAVEAPLVPTPAPRRRVVSRKHQPTPPASRETQWNIWTLEEVVRDNAPGNDELVYLTVSLREFADANGLLPVGFDPLVRESFGSLLPLAG